MKTNSVRNATLLIAALLGVAGHANAQREAVRSEIRGIVKSVETGSITITIGPGRDVAAVDKTYPLAKAVEIAVGSAFRFGGAHREASLKDLGQGTLVSLSLTADQKSVDGILAEEPMVRGILKSVDAKKRTLTMTTGPAQREQPAEDKVFTIALAADADVAVDDGRGRRFSIREGKLEELAEGTIITARLSLDKARVNSILAEGATVMGVIKSIDADKRMVTITTRPTRGDDAGEERMLAIAKEAAVLVDNGKGRRLSIKEAKLAEVPIGSMVIVKLAVDQSFVMMLKAEGPTVFGVLKSVDAKNGTVTIAIPKGRDDADEKSFALASDVRVTLDGNDTKLGDLKISDNGPFVQLRLSLDQKTVQSLTARQPGAR